MNMKGSDPVYIVHEIERVRSIADFREATGRRRLRQPYWVSYDDTSTKPPIRNFNFEFMRKRTEVKKLVRLIEMGVVWTLPRYLKIADKIAKRKEE
jgi:hypothetical protein